MGLAVSWANRDSYYIALTKKNVQGQISLSEPNSCAKIRKLRFQDFASIVFLFHILKVSCLLFDSDELDESLLPASLDVTLSVEERLSGVRSVLESAPPRSNSQRIRKQNTQHTKVRPIPEEYRKNQEKQQTEE